MHAWQIVDFGKPLEPREYPDPEPTGAQVLLRVTGCGVCHSDLHLWDGYFDLGGGKRLELGGRGMSLPFTMGHEIVGEVIALGPEAEGVAIGDRRVVFPWIGCGDCAECRRGEELLCSAPRTLGVRYGGGYADRVHVPHARYLVDFDGVDEALACTYACSGVTAYSALKKASAGLTADDSILIVGAGGVGLSAVQMARAVTPARIVVADIDEDKRRAAIAAGAVAAVDNGAEGALRKLRETTGGSGAAAAIDFVGAPGTALFGFDGIRRGGTLVIVGLYGGALSLSTAMFPLKMARVVGSYVGSLQEMHELMDMVRAGRVPPIPIRTRALRQVNATLADLREGRIVGRVVLQP
ncbi:D-arabinose 1-dehydrogenase-like Zn-dependent alcohol dehydrogenase [Constrictibacter sp. MBR-5]|jgi:D-arabinose 1-dehydrogenase-like Zn-dependent alcohol dehydrogenase|uniref:alcohol dehydrogenase n=1 Tax=Constrictibacter sp. MBR-5 TaxID=3156467 RepID=UPI0033907C75